MRLPSVLLVALGLPLLSGCLDGTSLGHVEMDCSDDTQLITSANRDILYPSTFPDEARPTNARASATVTAREGQTLYAHVAYAPSAGQVNVLLDAPHSNQASTENTWTSIGEVAAGDYTLELEGDPFAFAVQYTMVLMAAGCTPA